MFTPPRVRGLEMGTRTDPSVPRRGASTHTDLPTTSTLTPARVTLLKKFFQILWRKGFGGLSV